MLDDPRLTAMGLFAEAFTGLHAKIAPTLAAHGISSADFEVLLRLARSPGGRLRMSDLAAQAGLSTSGVTRVVDRLERAALVGRQTCSSDRRVSYAVITGAGEGLLAEVVPPHLDDVQRWFTGLLSVDQLAALLGALRIVRDRVRPEATLGAAGPPETPGTIFQESAREAEVSRSAPDGDDSASDVISM
jgi:DNA-binding MarR family transcriptional regulator